MGIDLSTIPLPPHDVWIGEQKLYIYSTLLADRRAVALAVLEAAAKVCDNYRLTTGSQTAEGCAITIRALGKDLV